MVFTKLRTFDVKVSAIIKIVYQFYLVCCTYRTRRGVSSTHTITPHGAE